MKRPFIYIIIFYQKVISLDQGFLPRLFGRNRKVCIYYPTCSEYMKQAIEKHGVLKGLRLGSVRIARCNPFHESSVDLVP